MTAIMAIIRRLNIDNVLPTTQLLVKLIDVNCLCITVTFIGNITKIISDHLAEVNFATSVRNCVESSLRICLTLDHRLSTAPPQFSVVQLCLQ